VKRSKGVKEKYLDFAFATMTYLKDLRNDRECGNKLQIKNEMESELKVVSR
jgi:hypothetical protein